MPNDPNSNVLLQKEGVVLPQATISNKPAGDLTKQPIYLKLSKLY